MLIVNICHFKLPRISLFKKINHCNLDIIGYWGIGTTCSNFFQLTISLFWLKFACHGVIRRRSFIIIARINHFYWLSFLVGWNSYKANDPSKSTIKTLLEQILNRHTYRVFIVEFEQVIVYIILLILSFQVLIFPWQLQCFFTWFCNISKYVMKASYKTCSEPNQISKMELFPKIVNGFHLLTIFARHCILGV